MSKMKTTAYANNVNVELIPGSRCIAVTVDDTGVAANSEGKKIVPAGTIVGGNVFADPANKVADANNPAKGDLESTGTNNDITVTNLTGSVIKVQLVDPAGNNKTLGLDLTTDTIKVMLATGGTGAISGCSNVFPELMVEIYEQWKLGDFEKANAAQKKIRDFRNVMQMGNPNSVVKRAAQLRGHNVGPAREPSNCANPVIDQALLDVFKLYE